MSFKLFGIIVSLEELFVGGFIQLPFYFLIGLWVIPLAVLSGLFWSLGGAEDSSKVFRRLGVPFLSCLFIWAVLGCLWWVWLAYPVACLATSLGYGKKSWLWGFFYGIRGNHKVADYLTRLTTYLLYWASFGLSLLFV